MTKIYDVRRGDTGEFLFRAPALMVEQILWLRPEATQRFVRENPCVLYANDKPFKITDASSVVVQEIDEEAIR